MQYKCSVCGKELERATKPSDLKAIPFEWYKNKKVFEKEVILHCGPCKMFRVLGRLDKLKYKIANKLLEM